MLGGAMKRMWLVAGLMVLCTCSRQGAPGGRENVRPAVLEWQIGITDKNGPSGMIETVLPATYAGKAVWRVVHRDPDPTEKDGGSFDMYDVDRETLVPVRSVMRREGFFLGLTFEGDSVEIEKVEGDQKSKTEVRVRNPMPEGPGVRVLVAALPLRVGYTAEFPVVDRWASDEAHRVTTMKLDVPKRATMETRLGRREVLEVVLAANDVSSSSRHWVRTEPPRYPYKIEYIRGDLHLISEVTRMAVEGGGLP
jgi:hypothetical protein